MSDPRQRIPSSLAEQLRSTRTQLMLSELERVSLRLFAERGFAAVTVEEIAAEAKISVRTFYRYFPLKEDVLQLQIDRRTETVRSRLATRPVDEAPLRSLRVVVREVVDEEDPEHLRLWCDVIAANPLLIRGVLGGLLLKNNAMMAAFIASRLGLEADEFVPMMLAAAVGGVIQAAATHWFVRGGDHGAAVSAGLEIIEQGIGGTAAPG